MSRILITGAMGYIGSVLTPHLRALGHDVSVIDPRAEPPTRYQDLIYGTGVHPDTIIHLAAHSSVGACVADPFGAACNNLTDLLPWSRTLTTEKFIFASSGSVFDTNTTGLYDATKRAAEQIIPYIYPNTYLLRFGTVCGVSPVMREDLILNGMVRDAVQRGVITVRNPGAWRPVLFFPDLCHAMERLVDSDARPGVYNLASFQARIGGWADMVAGYTGASIEDAGMSDHYDFKMPILPRSLVSVEDVIRGLAGYWREQS